MDSSKDELVAEMRLLRDRVVGITDTAVAAVDGLLIAADTDDGVEPEGLAALAAATLGLARRTAEAAGRGALRRTVAYCGGGYVVVHAVGEVALMAVLGDEGLDLTCLHAESQATVERIAALLTGPQETARQG